MKVLKKIITFLIMFSFVIGMAPMSNVLVQAAELEENVYVKIRYQRADSDYKDWNIWTWEEGKDGQQVDFIGTDEDGAFAVVNTTKAAGSLNFIIRKGNWVEKATSDVSVDLSKGDTEVVMTQGAEESVRTDREINKNLNEIKLNLHYFRYKGDYNSSNVSIWTDGEAEEKINFSSEDDYGKVATITKKNLENKNNIYFVIGNDINTARKINLAYANKNGVIDAYLLQETDKIYYKADEPIRYPEVTYFKIDSLNNMSFKVNSEVKKTDNIILKEGGKVLFKDDYSITLNENKLSGNIKLNKDLDINKTYTLEIPNYKSLDSSLGQILGSKLFEDLYKYDGELGAIYNKDNTKFVLWAPTATKVKVALYGNDGKMYLSKAQKVVDMTKGKSGEWTYTEKGDLDGVYYNYLVTVNGKENEVVDPYAQAVGVNGNRGMVVNLETTNPVGWETDKKPVLESPTDAMIYEMHIRDFSIDENSGITLEYRGKYKGVWQDNTTIPNKDIKTGVAHLKELGVNVVHLMPTYDYQSVDETKTSEQYNWGYDPQNFNVPEGSYSTDPYNGKMRIEEFKEMVQELHKQNIKVVMDVVYNHTFNNESSFEKAVPGYYYRFDKDGNFSNGSGTGNEVATERYMARRFIIDSLKYWVNEYHIDGFRFDLMGVYDIYTVKKIRSELDKIDPSTIIYGEGWSGGTTQLVPDNSVLKANCPKFGESQVAMFSDDIRDGLKGHVFTENAPGYINGSENLEDTIKFGIVASTEHDGIDYSKVNYSKEPWANEPYQTITYVTSHDNHMLWDRLQLSEPETSESERLAMNRLAATIVWTSQGIPFMQAGEEFARTKCDENGNLEGNSYQSPDSVNKLDWNRIGEYKDLYEYYVGLIKLRSSHKAFRMDTTKQIQDNLTFLENGKEFKGDNVVAYVLNGKNVGDSWNKIAVMFNSSDKAVEVQLPSEDWTVVVDGEKAGVEKLENVEGSKVTLPAKSSYVLVDTESYNKSNN